MDFKILKLTFSNFERRAFALVRLIDMVLVTKIYINFHTQVFNTFSRISGIKVIDFQTPDKTSDTIKYLPDILKIYWTSFIYVCFQLFYNLPALKIIRLNEKVQFTLENMLFMI